MTFIDRLLTFLLYAIAVVFVAGVVHLVAILIMPEFAPHDAFARISKLASTHQPVPLPQALPGKELTPFEDPAVAQAVCMFDLTHGSLHVHANIDPEHLLTLSFRGREGRVFYGVTDRAAVHGKIDIRIVTPEQLQALDAQDDEDNPPQELRLVAPQPKGFVLIDALVARPGERAAAEARAMSVVCAPEAVAQN
ncbi:MAG: hypothetical protein EPN75_01075 [Beijerinckiaceae bacterium]|nr:MAG: hypothetical protein EPN75_01075 [Beijerinckiaceae bacterium]